MHKNPLQNAGSGIKKALFFKIFGEHSAGPLRGSRVFGAIRADSCPPLKNFQTRTPMFLRGRRSERLSRGLV